MSEHHDEHGQDGHDGGHGSPGTGQWLEQHLSGIIVPFGARMEKLFEGLMVFIVNGVFLRLGVLCLVVMMPVLLLEFMLRAL